MEKNPESTKPVRTPTPEAIPDSAFATARRYFTCRRCNEKVLIDYNYALPAFMNSPGSCPNCWELDWHADAL